MEDYGYEDFFLHEKIDKKEDPCYCGLDLKSRPLFLFEKQRAGVVDIFD